MGDDGVIHYGDMDEHTFENKTVNTADMKYCQESDNNDLIYISRTSSFTKLHIAITQE
jgi:hypothetical protein